MISKRRRQLALIIAVFTVWVPVAAAAGPALQQTRNATRDFIHTPIASSSDLLELVKAVQSGRLPERRLILKVENGGLSFDLTERDLQVVMNAGGSNRLLETLKPLVKRPPPDLPKPAPPKPDFEKPVPMPPPAPKPGNLTVICEPVDCLIAINGKETGRTVRGESQPFELPAGTYSIHARADKYQPDEAGKSITIEPAAPARLKFHLEPTPQALGQAGRELYTKIIAQFGGEMLVKNAVTFKGSGSLELSDRQGVQSRWGVRVIFKAPDIAKFILARGGKESYSVLYRDGTYRWDHPPAESASLEDVLIQTCQFQPANLLAQFAAPSFTLSTNRVSSVPGSDSVLLVNGAPDSYVLTVDALFQPKEVRIKSAGLNNDGRALYGSYSNSASGIFPNLIQIVLPDRPRHGAQLAYSDFIYNPNKLGDKDFSVKHARKK